MLLPPQHSFCGGGCVGGHALRRNNHQRGEPEHEQTAANLNIVFTHADAAQSFNVPVVLSQPFERCCRPTPELICSVRKLTVGRVLYGTHTRARTDTHAQPRNRATAQPHAHTANSAALCMHSAQCHLEHVNVSTLEHDGCSGP